MRWHWSLGLLLGVIVFAVLFSTGHQERFPKSVVKPSSNFLPNRDIVSNVGGALGAAIVRSEPSDGFVASRNCPVHTQQADSEEPEQPIRSWVSENPVAAADWAQKQVDSALRQESLNHVALVWAETDLPKAIDWALKLPDDEDKAGVLINLGYEAARTEPVGALALATTLSSGQDRDDLIIHAVSQWANTDALAATEWACKIPMLDLRERVLASIATAMADQNPESAVILATQAIGAGESQQRAAIAIVQRWAQQDPLAASLWVHQFPPGALQEAARASLMLN